MKNALLRLFLLISLAASTAFATSSFSFQGTFLTDDQVELFQFTILSPQTVTAVSWG